MISQSGTNFEFQSWPLQGGGATVPELSFILEGLDKIRSQFWGRQQISINVRYLDNSKKKLRIFRNVLEYFCRSENFCPLRNTTRSSSPIYKRLREALPLYRDPSRVPKKFWFFWNIPEHSGAIFYSRGLRQNPIADLRSQANINKSEISG